MTDVVAQRQGHVWTTRDGTKVPVTEMTDTHLKNTIAMLRRLEATCADRVAASAAVASTLSGDMASYYAEGAIDHEICNLSAVQTWITILQAEQARRPEAA